MPSSVLIVLMGALGDLVRGLSVATAIKEQSPDTRIGWIVDKKWQTIAELHPAVDELHIFDRSAGFYGIRQLRKELRLASYEVLFDMQRHLKSGLCSWISGAPRRIGFHRKNSKEGNFLFTTETIPYRNPHHPKIDQYFDFLVQAGFEKPASVRFGFESVNADELLLHCVGVPETRYVACVLGSSWPSKDWPQEGYVPLAQNILDQSPYSVLLIGGPDQSERAESICRQNPEIQSLVGKTSLLELLGVLKRAVVAVGPDSGPGHIAAAVGTPYVSLFGPTPVARVAPYGMEDYAVTAPLACRPCYRRRCPGLNSLCMRLISPDAVWAQIQQLPGFNPFPVL